MGQSGPGNSPEVGRPRGSVWRTLVSEGIVWEGPVTIAGDHTDLEARLIVTGQRLVFVRNGIIALDAQRDWLEPAPSMGRNGRVSLAISTPNGNGPIPIQIRVQDGKFGAARLLSRLDDRPVANRSPFSPQPTRSPGRDQSARSGPTSPVSPSRRANEDRAPRAAPHPFRPESRPPPPVPTDPPATSTFGMPPSVLPTMATPMPSFGVVSAPRPDRPPGTTDPRPSTPFPADRPTAGAGTSPALSVDAISRAFGDGPNSTPEAQRSTSGPSPTLPNDPSRWTLASELLARSGPDGVPHPAASRAGPIGTPGSGQPDPWDEAIPTTAESAAIGHPLPLSAGPGPAGPPAMSSNSPMVPPSDPRTDPVSHARPPESPGSRSMLPGLPAEAPPSDAAVDRRRVSAAPSGRVAGNSVITARSSAAARQAAKQFGSATKIAPDDLMPSAVALAGAQAGVPLALASGSILAGDVPVMADSSQAPNRRGFLARLGGGINARAAWGLTAFALVALTVAAGLYLALGIPDGGGNGSRTAGLNQPPAGESNQVAIVAATPSASTRPAPTATRSWRRDDVDASSQPDRRSVDSVDRGGGPGGQHLRCPFDGRRARCQSRCPDRDAERSGDRRTGSRLRRRIGVAPTIHFWHRVRSTVSIGGALHGTDRDGNTD